MYNLFLTSRAKKGFTLMEMLIVVAIIAILVAIAIPVFSAQLEKARERVDEANERSIKSMAVATAMLDAITAPQVYVGVPSANDSTTMTIASSASLTTLPTGYTAGNGYGEGTDAPPNTESHVGGYFAVAVDENYEITDSGWTGTN